MSAPNSKKQRAENRFLSRETILIGEGTDPSGQPGQFPVGVIFLPRFGRARRASKSSGGASGGILLVTTKNQWIEWFNRNTLVHIQTSDLKGLDEEKGDALGKFKNFGAMCLQPTTNRLVVCDPQNSRVQILHVDDEDCTIIPLFCIGGPLENEVDYWQKTPDHELMSPTGVCCSPNGVIHVVDHKLVKSFDAVGRFLSSLEFPAQSLPRRTCYVSPAFAPSFSGTSVLAVGDPARKVVSFWDSGVSFSRPRISAPRSMFSIECDQGVNEICVDLKGNLHISCDDNTIRIYDIRMAGGSVSNSSSSSSNNNNNNGDRALIQTLGEPSSNGSSKPGMFAAPCGMCVDDVNTLVVADTFNERIQFFVDASNGESYLNQSPLEPERENLTASRKFLSARPPSKP